MELLSNGFTLEISPGAFPLSTDSVLLADFTKLPKNARVLDLGSGCGTLGIYLCAKDPGCHVTGIELSEQAHLAALHNIEANALSHRMKSICADLRTVPAEQTFDVCISNPPYFSGGPASKTVPDARRNDSCSTQELLSAADRALRYGGDLFLVQKPELLAEICACASAAHLEPKRLRLIRHRTGGDISLILLQCRKGGKPGLSWEELCLFTENGEPTPYYRELYHL